MKEIELRQIHQRFFNSPIAEGDVMLSGQTNGFHGSEKTCVKKQERKRIKEGVLLFPAKVRKNGQVIGQTFRGSVRDTYNLKPKKQA